VEARQNSPINGIFRLVKMIFQAIPHKIEIIFAVEILFKCFEVAVVRRKWYTVIDLADLLRMSGIFDCWLISDQTGYLCS
jgi:hypothetical protein